MMSSEESDLENNDLIVVKPISWRSERVSSFFRRLDTKVISTKSTQSKRQRKERIESSQISTRLKPSLTLPDWAVGN